MLFYCEAKLYALLYFVVALESVTDIVPAESYYISTFTFPKERSSPQNLLEVAWFRGFTYREPYKSNPRTVCQNMVIICMNVQFASLEDIILIALSAQKQRRLPVLRLYDF